MQPELTTMCYIEQDGKYLMLHRTKKENDPNAGLWLAPGGHFEDGESPEECIRRELMEECGVIPEGLQLRGIVTFRDGDWMEYMFLFTASGYKGELHICSEGDLEWVTKERVRQELPIWEGDRVFLQLLEEGYPFFSLKLTYQNRRLVQKVLDGKVLN